MALQNEDQYLRTREKFLNAREISQQVIPEIAENDKQRVAEILNSTEVLLRLLGNTLMYFTNSSAFSAHLETMDLIESGSKYIDMDVDIILKYDQNRYITIINLIKQIKLYNPFLELELYFHDTQDLLELHENYSSLVDTLLVCVAMKENLTDIGEYVNERNVDNWERWSNGDDNAKYVIVNTCNKIIPDMNYNIKELVLHSNNSAGTMGKDVVTSYNTFIDDTFTDTSIDPNDIPQHVGCSKHLQYFTNALKTFESTDAVLRIMQNEKDFHTMLNHSIVLLRLLQDSGFYNMVLFDAELEGFENMCLWASRYVRNIWTGSTTESLHIDTQMYQFQRHMDHVYQNYPAAKGLFKQIIEHIEFMDNFLSTRLRSLLDTLREFQKGRLLKSQLAEMMGNFYFKQIMSDFVEESVDLENAEQDFRARMEDISASLIEAYTNIIDQYIPILGSDEIMQLQFIEHIAVPSQNKAVREKLQNMNSNVKDNFLGVIEVLYGVLTSETKQIQQNIGRNAQIIITVIQHLEENLEEFRFGNTMDTEFFM